ELGNDHWRGTFPVDRLGQYIYTITAWIDFFQTWYKDFLKRIAANQDVTVDLQIGAGLLKAAAERAIGADAGKLLDSSRDLKVETVDDLLATLASEYPDLRNATHYRTLRANVYSKRARFS